MRSILIGLIVLYTDILPLNAQPYIEGGKTRHRFAQLNLGVDQRYFNGKYTQSSFINSNGNIENFELQNLNETRIIIGGTHFWGHADFFIAVPILSSKQSGFKTSVETGLKIFPWKIKHLGFRPYIGASWMPCSFQQGEGTHLSRSKYPITSGLVYNYKNHLVELGLGYLPNNTFNYYITKNIQQAVKTHGYWIALSYKFMIETTLSAEKDWQSGRTKKLTDTLAVLKRLNGFTLAVGPSSAFYTKSSSYNTAVVPFADDHKFTDVFPEFGIGYYLHKPDVQINLAYRTVKSELKAFDFNQNLNRKALTVEAYKFLFDYHGFVPFVGASASYEWLLVKENFNGQLSSASNIALHPGFTFGWDIRPNRIQAIYLRTNLRYIPNLNVKMAYNKNMAFDQLEFNFIQLVVFPNRLF
ncbi:MAG TPA: hypothetical protein PK323_02780 [Bacteroidia bacterium]|nr:hypothetical protein [Bacteroidia bacterium]